MKIAYIGHLPIHPSLLCRGLGISLKNEFDIMDDGIDIMFENINTHIWIASMYSQSCTNDPIAATVKRPTLHAEYQKIASADAIICTIESDVGLEFVVEHTNEWIDILARDMSIFGGDINNVPIVFQAIRDAKDPPGVLWDEIKKAKRTNVCAYTDSTTSGDGIKESFSLALTLARHRG